MNYEEVRKNILDFTDGRFRLICIGKRVALKTKLGMSEKFNHSTLYNEIFKVTDFLPKETDIFHRLKALFLNVRTMEYCPMCGNPLKITENLSVKESFFCSTCGSKNCIAKLASSKIGKMSDELKEKHREYSILHCSKIASRFVGLVDIHNNFKQTVSDDEISSYLNHKLNEKISSHKMNISFFNNNCSQYEMEVLKNLIFKTKFIPFDNIKSKRDLRISERVYCFLNKLTKIPFCRFCGKTLKFISFNSGYTNTCPDCWVDGYRERIGYPTSKEMIDMIDKNRFDVISFPSKTDSNPLVLKCKRCNNVFNHYIYNGRGRNIILNNLCPTCDRYVSNGESELRDFVSTLCDDMQCNRRDIIPPYELDIFSKTNNIAIEFDGLYFHSNKIRQPSYHALKTKLCNDINIRLVHVFENEWNIKREIVKSRLKNIFGKFEKTIYARKCTIKCIGNEYIDFLNKNHIQGSVYSPIKIGLFYDGELISIMTFGKNRFKKTNDNEFELLRFCNKLGYHIPGGASKILTYFERNYSPTKIISYCDKRWGTGMVYLNMGFNLSHETRPNYWYFKHGNNILLSRLQFQKHKLKSILPEYDDTLSESENMLKNGYHRIFDCGNLVFVKEYPEIKIDNH